MKLSVQAITTLVIVSLLTIETFAESSTGIEHTLVPHWKVIRQNIEFDLSPQNIVAINGQTTRLYIEVKKLEEQGDQLVEIPLAQFELGPSNSKISIGSYGGPVQSQTLKGQNLKEHDRIKIVIREYTEHLIESTDRIVGRVVERLNPKKKIEPRPEKILLEETFTLQ